MTVERMRIGWRFWLQWVFASVVGWWLGWIVGLLVGLIYGLGAYQVGDTTPDYAMAAMATGLGAGVGIMQRRIVQRHVSGARWWALASILGLGLTTVVGIAVMLARGYSIYVGEPLAPAESWIIIAAVGGAMAGVTQWSILRRQFSQAGWWVLASGAGWAVGLAVVARFMPVLNLAGAVWLGAVTGLALVWLLRQPAKEA